MNYETEITLEEFEAGLIDGYVIDVKTELEAFKQLKDTLLHLDIVTYNEINKLLTELSNESEEEAHEKYHTMYLDGLIRQFEYLNAVDNRLDSYTFESIGINNVYEEGLFKSKTLGIYAVSREMYKYKCYNMNSIPELLSIFAHYDEIIDILFEKFNEYTGDVFVSAKDRLEELFQKNII